MTEEEYYTPEEFSKIFKVKKRTVYFWVRTGKLKAVKLGSLLRIPKSALDDFLRSSKDE